MLSFNQIFWKACNAKDCGLKHFHYHEYPFSKLNPSFSNEEANRKLSGEKLCTENFYYTLSQVLIEPNFFTVLKGSRSFVEESVFYPWVRPSASGRVKQIIGLNKTVFIKEAVLFDNYIGLNYFHFFNDILPVLFLLKELGLEKLPILIGKKLYETKWFGFFITQPEFNYLKWIVCESGVYYSVNKLHFLRARPYDLIAYKQITQITKRENFNSSGSKRIFIERTQNDGRYIENADEINTVLNEFGFEKYDLRNMSFVDQIRLFQQAKVISGSHGAGFTNILFAKENQPLVIELFPSNFISAHFYWMSSILQIQYAFIIGDELKMNQVNGKHLGYQINPDELRKQYASLLSGTKG